MKTREKIFIGTSGWSYSHWKDNFYPPKLNQAEWLKYYSESFSTVEVNSTFYRLPSITTVQNWYAQVPSNFLFSIKASRYITHLKRLKDCQELVSVFFDRISYLNKKTAPILFQLPPSFKNDQNLLRDFIEILRPEFSYVFEFRHATWFVDEIYELLASKKIALCITDLNKKLSPEEITAPFTYIRLHGPEKAYQGTYGPKKLKEWHNKINFWTSQKIKVFCYFDNDEKGFAIQDAKQLKALFL